MMRRGVTVAKVTTLAVLAATALIGQTVQFSLQEKENFLKTAKITRMEGLSQGVTRSRRATLSNGTFSHDAHIQTIDKYKSTFTSSMGTELNFRDTYKGNIAAYRLDKMLKLGMIPPAVERRVNGYSAAVTWWVDNTLMTEKKRFLSKREPPDRDRWNKQIYIVRVFDQLIYNVDRNLGNLVITNDWNLKMIDHTRAFRLHKNLRAPENLTRCDRALLDRLRKLNADELMRELRPYLTKGEILALLARRDLILEHFEKAAVKQGVGFIYYDFLRPGAPQ